MLAIVATMCGLDISATCRIIIAAPLWALVCTRGAHGKRWYVSLRRRCHVMSQKSRGDATKCVADVSQNVVDVAQNPNKCTLFWEKFQIDDLISR